LALKETTMAKHPGLTSHSTVPLNRRQVVTRGLALGLAGMAGGLALQGPAVAQTYPSKPVRFVVPYPPGGGTDVIARIVQEPLAAVMNTSIIIDNKGGAGGSIGSDAVAKSAADGYTLLFTCRPTPSIPACSRSSPSTPRRTSPASRWWPRCRRFWLPTMTSRPRT
jgi:Tripartite tricarboxylate transporter family receptor